MDAERFPLAARILVVVSLCSSVSCGRPNAPQVAPRSNDPAAATPAEEEAFAHQEQVVPYVTWAAQRRSRGTHLRPLRENEKGPPRSLEPPPGATRVSYLSQGRTLGGWAKMPAPNRSAQAGLVAGVLYLHHAFSLTPEAWQNAQPFVDAGYAVFLPALRGENGNPGERELLFGEVDDARAAVAWLAAQPGVDARRLFVIGHSMGGGIASLLALDPPPGVVATASVGGIYRAQTFHFWAEDPESEAQVRFDTSDAFEMTSRLFLAHVRDVAAPHYAFAGAGDDFDTRYATLASRRAREASTRVLLVPVAGDHMGAVGPAVQRFVDTVRSAPSSP